MPGSPSFPPFSFLFPSFLSFLLSYLCTYPFVHITFTNARGGQNFAATVPRSVPFRSVPFRSIPFRSVPFRAASLASHSSKPGFLARCVRVHRALITVPRYVTRSARTCHASTKGLHHTRTGIIIIIIVIRGKGDKEEAASSSDIWFPWRGNRDFVPSPSPSPSSSLSIRFARLAAHRSILFYTKPNRPYAQRIYEEKHMSEYRVRIETFRVTISRIKFSKMLQIFSEENTYTLYRFRAYLITENLVYYYFTGYPKFGGNFSGFLTKET